MQGKAISDGVNLPYMFHQAIGWDNIKISIYRKI
jgi:hypothetical protein